MIDIHPVHLVRVAVQRMLASRMFAPASLTEKLRPNIAGPFRDHFESCDPTAFLVRRLHGPSSRKESRIMATDIPNMGTPEKETTQQKKTTGEREIAPQRRGGTGEISRRELSPSVTPFSFMRRMMEDMERMFDRSFGRSLLPDLWTNERSSFLWNPEIDVFERGDRLVVRADLPGIERDQVHLRLEEVGLVIEGERKEEHEERGERGYYRSERTYGSFRRVVPLPDGVEGETATAEMKNGVLEVSFKKPEAKTRGKRIEIGGESKTKSVH
jgi:HSP20 family protein